MLATAYHPDARSDDLVVVGSSDDNKKIHQGLAQISAVRHRPGDDKPLDSWRGGRVTKQLKINDVSDHITRTVVYSAKVSRLDAGDQLVIDALPKIEIGGYPYNVFTRTEVVLAKNRHSVKPFGKLTETTARASASNGFNCTQGSSAHARVCGEHKTGVLSIKKNANGPFYVNVVMGQTAIGTAPQTDHWRPGRHEPGLARGLRQGRALQGRRLVQHLLDRLGRLQRRTARRPRAARRSSSTSCGRSA